MSSGISEESSSSSQGDSNANLNNGHNHNQSKGAIPKMKYVSKNHNDSRKKIKVNNNIENNFTVTNPDPTTVNVITSNKINTREIENGFANKGIDESKIMDSSFNNMSLEITIDERPTSSSSAEDNDLSISDDGCIYTYKGDSFADLPNSFFNIVLPIENNDQPEVQRESTSSPEMDYLEMDFDPGPSGDADSESSSSSKAADITNQSTCNNAKSENDLEPCCSKNLEALIYSDFDIQREPTLQNRQKNNHIVTSDEEDDLIMYNSGIQLDKTKRQAARGGEEMIIKMPWSCNFWERTKPSKDLRVMTKHMNPFGELSSPQEPSKDFENNSNDREKNDKIMVWHNQEASLKQITQIGPSSCGATAVLNVLIALRLPIPSLTSIRENVSTSYRNNFGPLTEYLLSRSKAGCSHKEIITGLSKSTNGRVYARFFSMYPERRVNLYRWLGFWICNGAVPIATLNIQKSEGVNNDVPDSWHHQMIFGVDSDNVYLTNPLECVDGGALWHQLVSESVLLIRREDVLSRWNAKTDFVELGKVRDKRWQDLNVLGQIAKVVREQRRETREKSVVTSHIKIPAVYRSGVTLAIDINSSAYPLLRECPELPLLNNGNADID